MALIQKTYTFVANTRALAAQVNQDFDDVINILKGDHHNPAVYSNAFLITRSGIAPNANIQNGMLAILTLSGLVNQNSLQQITQPGIIQSSALPNLNSRVFVITTSQTWAVPAGVAFFTVELMGGGASGAGSSGGGGGAYVKKLFAASALGSSVVVTIGAGGAGVADNVTGSNGGDTTFGALLTAAGAITTTGGVATGGDLNINGQNGSTSTQDAQTSGSPAFYMGIGGNSMLGFSNPSMQFLAPSSSIVSGNTGTGYGSGGGGAGSTAFGNHGVTGSGQPGVCIISW